MLASDHLHDRGPLGPFDPAAGSEKDLAHPAAGDELEEQVTTEPLRQDRVGILTREAAGDGAGLGVRDGRHVPLVTM